jgi:preprotein translocase subunit SecG
METFATVVHVITCVLIIIVVLMQSGKGADISASLGGSSNTVFGSSGGANFFTKATFTLAAIFMITSLGLTIIGSKQRRSVFDDVAPTSIPQESSPSGADTSTAPTEPTATSNSKS